LVETPSDATAMASVEILDRDLCGRFGGRVLENIVVGTSPPWLANRLRSLGMRPINSIVDISNYVMLELGQPNHTFDLAKVEGRHLRVRMAAAGEKITTLDGVERTLTADDGVIADGNDVPVSIAGIMGGASTEISETTNTVLLEMAWWDPTRMARSSRRLGLRSEASARFERGTDPEVIELAMLRFAELAGQSGATLATGLIDEPGNRPEPAKVRLRTGRVNALLGTGLKVDEIRSLLEPIGFRTSPAGEDQGDTDVAVPTFRPDTTTEVDVIEEVARHHGYTKIARTIPSGSKAGSLSPAQRDRRLVRSVLVGYGADEAMPVPFLAPGDLVRAGLDDSGIRVANPLVAEESIMRTALLPGLLKAVAYNQSHRSPDIALFEVGHVYGPVPEGGDLPDERERLGVILEGREAPEGVELWTLIATALGVREDRLIATELPGLHPTRAARIEVGDQTVGAVGEIDPRVLDRYEISGRVAWLDVDLTTLFGIAHGAGGYRRISRQPSSDIDLAFVIDESIPAADVESTLVRAGGDLLVALALFDTYRGSSLPDGVRSLAYNLRFQASDKTLTDGDVAGARQRCIDAVANDHGGELRS